MREAMRRFTELLGSSAPWGDWLASPTQVSCGAACEDLVLNDLKKRRSFSVSVPWGGVLVPPVQVSWGYSTMQPWGRGEGVYFRCSGLG